MERTKYNIPAGTKPERLDIYLSLKTGLSRGRIQKLIKQGLVQVNSKTQKASYKMRQGDMIEVAVPDEPENTLVPEDIPLDIIYEDEHLIAVNKPPGMVVYPAAGHRSGTLMNALMFRCKKLASTGAPLRPGVVHRLDKDTSGVMVLAKNDSAYLNLCGQFRERTVEKQYIALLYGNLKNDAGEINAPIGRAASDRKKMAIKTKKGKEAITRYDVIKRFKSAMLAKVSILTGRTHQIRVHLASAGHPVLGDKTYGKKVEVRAEANKKILFSRQMLHAQSLKIKHPVSHEPLELTAPLPDDMKKAVSELSGQQA
ncbi:MAG: RluA family pseudouridine synthase [Nitrospirae bacterium]|nr:RluA family pseudouridine synthase [Nitrospirota bacterium]